MPTHFQNGVSNVATGSPLFEYGMVDQTKWITYFNDFLTYTAGDWTITTVETGSATEAVVAGSGGWLGITNGTADNDNDYFQLGGALGTFRYVSTKKMFFRVKLKVDDIDLADVYAGLIVTDTSPIGADSTPTLTDGIGFFTTSTATATMDFLVEESDNATTASAVAPLVDDPFITLAFFYDPQTGTFKYYVDDVLTGSSVNTNVPDDVDLALSFGIQNGSAAARTLTIDHIMVSLER